MYNKPATHLFHEPVLAQYVRICPVQWVGSISLRLELLGSLGKTKVNIISHQLLLSTVFLFKLGTNLPVSIKTKSYDAKRDINQKLLLAFVVAVCCHCKVQHQLKVVSPRFVSPPPSSVYIAIFQ